jgi:hypothetical protein
MRRNVRNVIGALSLAAVAVLGLAACGSSDRSSGSTGTSASAGTSGGSAGTSAGSGGDDSDLCTYAKQLEQSLNPDSLSTPDKATFDKVQEIIANVQAKAPDEIKADVATVAENFKNVQAIFSQYDYDIAKLTSAVTADPTLAQKLQALSGDDFNAASQRVDTYLQEHCGITAGS